VTSTDPELNQLSDEKENPDIGDRIGEFLTAVADFAAGFQRRLAWFLGIAAMASAYLAWLLYSPESLWWWNLIKCGLVLTPTLVWLFIWQVLGEMREAPGLRGLFSTLRAFREEDGLEVVLDTLGGVTLLANPVFAIFAFIMSVLLWIFILLAPFLLLF